jgi:hypothetical protein
MDTEQLQKMITDTVRSELQQGQQAERERALAEQQSAVDDAALPATIDAGAMLRKGWDASGTALRDIATGKLRVKGIRHRGAVLDGE